MDAQGFTDAAFPLAATSAATVLDAAPTAPRVWAGTASR
jgi:hypothetical protein